MSDSSNEGFETKAIHSGQEYDQWSNLETVPPIVTSMTFHQHDPTNMKVNICFNGFSTFVTHFSFNAISIAGPLLQSSQ